MLIYRYIIWVIRIILNTRPCLDGWLWYISYMHIDSCFVYVR